MGKQKEIKLVNLLLVLVAIIVVIIVIRNIIKKNKSDNNDMMWGTAEKQIEQEKESDRSFEEFVQVLEDGTKVNISSKLKEDKALDNLKITDISLTYKDNATRLLAVVENNQEEDTEITNIEVELIDKQGNTIRKFNGIIEGIKAGEKAKLNCSITTDCVNAYNLLLRKK